MTISSEEFVMLREKAVKENRLVSEVIAEYAAIRKSKMNDNVNQFISDGLPLNRKI